MATTFYLRGTNIAAGGTQNLASLTKGAASADVTASTNPPNDVLIARYVSRPLVGFTLSGNVAVNVWANEDAATTNSAIRCIVKKMNSSYTISSNIAVLTSTELGTKTAAVSLTNTAPTSTAVANGEFLVFEFYASPSGGSPAASKTVTLSYNGPTAAAQGDSYVTLFENIVLRDRYRAGT